MCLCNIISKLPCAYRQVNIVSLYQFLFICYFSTLTSTTRKSQSGLCIWLWCHFIEIMEHIVVCQKMCKAQSVAGTGWKPLQVSTTESHNFSLFLWVTTYKNTISSKGLRCSYGLVIATCCYVFRIKELHSGRRQVKKKKECGLKCVYLVLSLK